MTVTLEQIEMLRQRANVTYAEAKEVLEKCNGDIVEAMIMLEGQAKVREPQSQTHYHGHGKSFFSTAKKILKKCNATKFTIRKGDHVIIDIPATILIIVAVAMLPLTLAGLVLALVTGHKFAFVKPDGGGVKFNQAFDKMSNCVTSVSNQVVDAFKDEEVK